MILYNLALYKILQNSIFQSLQICIAANSRRTPFLRDFSSSCLTMEQNHLPRTHHCFPILDCDKNNHTSHTKYSLIPTLQSTSLVQNRKTPFSLLISSGNTRNNLYRSFFCTFKYPQQLFTSPPFHRYHTSSPSPPLSLPPFSLGTYTSNLVLRHTRVLTLPKFSPCMTKGHVKRWLMDLGSNIPMYGIIAEIFAEDLLEPEVMGYGLNLPDNLKSEKKEKEKENEGPNTEINTTGFPEGKSPESLSRGALMQLEIQEEDFVLVWKNPYTVFPENEDPKSFSYSSPKSLPVGAPIALLLDRYGLNEEWDSTQEEAESLFLMKRITEGNSKGDMPNDDEKDPLIAEYVRVQEKARREFPSEEEVITFYKYYIDYLYNVDENKYKGYEGKLKNSVNFEYPLYPANNDNYSRRDWDRIKDLVESNQKLIEDFEDASINHDTTSDKAGNKESNNDHVFVEYPERGRNDAWVHWQAYLVAENNEDDNEEKVKRTGTKACRKCMG